MRALDPELIANSNSSFRLSVLSDPLWTKFHSIRFDDKFNERHKHDKSLHTFLHGVGIGTKSQIPVSDFPPTIRITHSIDDALTFLFSASPQPHQNPSHMTLVTALYAERDELLQRQRGEQPPHGDEAEDIHMRLDRLHQTLIPEAEHAAVNYNSPPVPFHAPFDPAFVHRCSFLCPYNNDVDRVNAECERLIQNAHPHTVFHSLRSADAYQQGNLPPVQPMFDVPQDQVLNDIELAYARDNDDIQGVDVAEDPQVFDYANGLRNERLDQQTFSVEHLNSQRPPGCPPFLLRFSVGMVVMMIRNLDASRRMLNGKRFVVTHIHDKKRLVFVTPAETYGSDDSPIYAIPRILFKGRISRSQDANLLRKQFPLRTCYAVTIHKSQSSTLDRVVVDLRQGIFDHGQLYVALSRVRKGTDLMILIRPDQTHIRNIVHQILLGLGW